jgi:hypothetical protein
MDNMVHSRTFVKCDRIAARSQLKVEALVLASLGAEIGVSLVFALNLARPSIVSQAIAIDSIIILLLIGIVSQIVLQFGHIEDHWFQARAIAETAKSLIWQYMMGVADLDDSHFLKSLYSARAEYAEALRLKDADFPLDSEITVGMVSVRDLGWEEKRAEYLRHRIDDQLRWYDEKARHNKRLASSYRAATMSLQVVGIAVAIYGFYFGIIATEVALGVVVTIVASLIGWSQSRRYAELVEPYLYSAQVLHEMKKEIERSANEERFRELVKASEGVISREHQMWQLRRGLTVERLLEHERFSLLRESSYIRPLMGAPCQ